MDLKSMLNDSSVQRQPPRLHTPQSSFDRGAENTPGNDSASDRYHHYHSQSHSADSRSPHSAGYYVAAHSPRQHHSASTPGAAGPSIYAQSPGGHGQPYTPRESIPPQNTYNANYIASPSPHPPTPGASNYFQNSSQNPNYTQPPGPHRPVQRQATREELYFQNGIQHQQPSHASPRSQTHAPVVTPLGPPAPHPRPSPHSQRPTSQGHDGFRRSSYGSVGSSHSRDYSVQHLAQPPVPRAVGAHRTHSTEEERHKRERSFESVSPKTIPRPAPQQQPSFPQETPLEHHTHLQPQYTAPPPQVSPNKNIEGHNQTQPAKPSAPASEPRGNSQHSSNRPSPATGGTNTMTPQSTHSSLPPEPSPHAAKQPSLKRNASVISTMTTTTMPPRKRLRRDEIPIYAQDARRGRPLRLDVKGPTARPPRKDNAIKRGVEDKPVSNGHPPSTEAPSQQAEPGWEPSILNVVPYEDLTRRICDWIVSTIGHATPPAGGAMFEIEAKVGAIVEADDGVRLRLPVQTETVFARDMWKRTKFESTMDMAQHRQLNTFLNNIVQQSFAEAHNSNREMVHHSHLKEADEFFELTPEGRKNLPQSIAHWLNPRHKPRVRRTIDATTGQVKAQIIKSRIADLEVYNPGADFDYRISISIESPWEGEPHHLTEMTEGGRDRRKDRMSYRHLAYQIDLTQVSYASTNKLEHELEVEISTEQIRKELDNLRNQRPSRYEDLVRGFIDNVRILCRKGTVAK